MPSLPEEAFLEVWERIWDIQKDEGVKQSLNDIEIKKIYLEASKTYIIMNGIAGILILLVNLPVVISCILILRKGKGIRSTYWLLGNISFSDMIVGFMLIGKLATLLYPASKTSVIRCDVCIGVCAASGINSLYCVAIIAIDRYLYIVHGLKYNQWVTPIRLKIVMLLNLMHAILIGILPYLLWNSDGRTTSGRECLLVIRVNPNYLTIVALSSFVPITIACIFQGLILYNAIKNVIKLKSTRNMSNKLRIFRGQSSVDDAEDRGPSKLKAIKVVLFTTGSMIVTIVPCLIASLAYANCDSYFDEGRCKTLKFVASMPLYVLMVGNSFMNPIIYAWWHKGFRHSLKKIYLTKVKQHQLNKQLEVSIMEREIRTSSEKSVNGHSKSNTVTV